MLTRRSLLALTGGGLLATTTTRPLPAAGRQVIEMRGTPRGEQVWFTPLGLAVRPGTTIRFVNRDPANSHTATTYHPDLFDRPQRIPDGAAPWDSGYLLPDEAFDVTLSHPGVYDFYCLPHELAGMVGRLVVGRPSDEGWQDVADVLGELPHRAWTAFPSVTEILKEGQIYPEEPS